MIEQVDNLDVDQVAHPKLQASFNNAGCQICTTDVEPAWDLRPTGWRVRVHGDAPLDVGLAFPIAVEELGSVTPAYTANRPVNAVPYVCAAAPGILSTADLPPITPAGPRPRTNEEKTR